MEHHHLAPVFSEDDRRARHNAGTNSLPVSGAGMGTLPTPHEEIGFANLPVASADLRGDGMVGAGMPNYGIHHGNMNSHGNGNPMRWMHDPLLSDSPYTDPLNTGNHLHYPVTSGPYTMSAWPTSQTINDCHNALAQSMNYDSGLKATETRLEGLALADQNVPPSTFLDLGIDEDLLQLFDQHPIYAPAEACHTYPYDPRTTKPPMAPRSPVPETVVPAESVQEDTPEHALEMETGDTTEDAQTTEHAQTATGRGDTPVFLPEHELEIERREELGSPPNSGLEEESEDTSEDDSTVEGLATPARRPLRQLEGHEDLAKKIKDAHSTIANQRKQHRISRQLGVNVNIRHLNDGLQIGGVYWYPPSDDETIPRTPDQVTEHVAQLVEAMLNDKNCREKNTTSQWARRWKEGADFYKLYEMRACCRDIVKALIDLHLHGWTKPIYDKDQRELFQKTQGFTFEERFRCVVELVKYSKTTCADLLKGDRLYSIIGNPFALYYRTASNENSNKIKATRIALATDYEKKRQQQQQQQQQQEAEMAEESELDEDVEQVEQQQQMISTPRTPITQTPHSTGRPRSHLSETQSEPTTTPSKHRLDTDDDDEEEEEEEEEEDDDDDDGEGYTLSSSRPTFLFKKLRMTPGSAP